MPIRILEYGLAPDSAGAGRHRGGLSTTMLFQVFAPHTVAHGAQPRPHGLHAVGDRGWCGGPSPPFIRNPGTTCEVDLGNTDVVTVEPGDIIRITAAGGGGWGPAHERDPRAVMADVRGGFVTVAGAACDYGVVIRNGAIDEGATAARRRAMAAGAGNEFFGHSPGRVAFEKVWTPQLYDRLMDLLWRVPVNWRFLVKHRLFAAVAALDTDNVDPDALDGALATLIDEHPQLREWVAADRT